MTVSKMLINSKDLSNKLRISSKLLPQGRGQKTSGNTGMQSRVIESLARGFIPSLIRQVNNLFNASLHVPANSSSGGGTGSVP